MLVLGFSVFGAGLVGRPGTSLGAEPGTLAEPAGADPLPRRSQFTAAIGATFVASDDTNQHRLRLVEILDIAPSAVPGHEHAFNLIFDQLGAPVMEQGIYRLTARRTPACSLFLSPVDRPATRRQFQALVNRQS
jgi:hypothetical protein